MIRYLYTTICIIYRMYTLFYIYSHYNILLLYDNNNNAFNFISIVKVRVVTCDGTWWMWGLRTGGDML